MENVFFWTRLCFSIFRAVLAGLNFKNWQNCKNLKSFVETWTFFTRLIFIVDFKYDLKIDKFLNLIRGSPFVHFWHFRKDLSDHIQTLPKYRGHHFEKNHGKKLAIILAILPFEISKIVKITKIFKVMKIFF